jgi:hypothetical protein
MTKNYQRKEPLRVETLIMQKKINNLFNVVQEFLRNMDNYPKQDALLLNDLLQAVGQGIEVVNGELIRRGKNVK